MVLETVAWANLTPRMLPRVPRAPGQCVANEKELHVVKGKGWQPGAYFWKVEIQKGNFTCGPHGLDAIGCRQQGPSADLRDRQDSRRG